MPSNIPGLDAVVRQLNSLKGLTPHSVLAGALVLQKYSMENAPVLTGFLKNSAESHETGDGAELEFHANYAAHQEFGTSRMAAQPFVRPAVDEHGQDIVKAVAEQIQKDMKGLIK
jgi:HK97 gp10 family phage protein